MLTFLDDMPLSQRRASKSPHKPLGETVASGNSWCTECTNYCASACNQCLSQSQAELSLRAKGVTRCRLCKKNDLIVKGADRTDGLNVLFDCGTCCQGTWQAFTNGKPTHTRGSCSSCHRGRTCPICHDYCVEKSPPACVRCDSWSMLPGAVVRQTFSGSLVLSMLFSSRHCLAAVSILPSKHSRSTGKRVKLWV